MCSQARSEGRRSASVALGVGHLVELLGVGAVGALDAAVQLRAPGRQDEQGDPALGARRLELGHELRAVLDADGAHRERHPGGERVEDRGRRAGARGRAQLEDVPAADHVARRELLRARAPGAAGRRACRAGPGHRGRAATKSAGLRTACGRGQARRRALIRRGAGSLQLARPPQSSEDPADHRAWTGRPRTPEEDHELVLALSAGRPPQAAHRGELAQGPARAAPADRAGGPVLEGLQTEAVEPAEPAIDGRTRVPEVAGRAAHVAAVGAMPVEHRQPDLRPARIRTGAAAATGRRSTRFARWFPGDAHADA